MNHNSKQLLVDYSKEFFYNDIFSAILLNPKIKEDKTKYMQKIPLLLAYLE